jgi:hypothetical protein
MQIQAFIRIILPGNAIAIVPFGVFDKAAIVKQMGSANSQFKSSKIEDTKAIVPTPESGLVTYKAIYEKQREGTNNSYSVFVTTVYAKINDEWKGVFYQQTPVQKEALNHRQ